MRLRKIGDYLIAPKRGPIPECPKGYKRVSGDPYTFERKLFPCKYREHRLQKSKCCESIILYCNKILERVSREDCFNCEITK